jgi:membrane protease YdiL (CAAX protease family)
MRVSDRSAVVALLLTIPVPSLAVLAGMVWWPGTALGQAMFAGGKAWILMLPLVWHLLIDRERPSWSPMRRGALGLGVLSGLVIAVGIAGTFLLCRDRIAIEPFRAPLERAGITSLPIFIALALYTSFINALLEEYVWRWFVAGRAARVMPHAAAVVVAALAFAAHHLIAVSQYLPLPLALLATLGVAIGGGWWSWMYLRFGSVWPGYVSHVLVDLAIFAIGGWLLFG